jgi:hypothetical protein
MLDFVAGKPLLINNPIKNSQAKKPGSFFVLDLKTLFDFTVKL